MKKYADSANDVFTSTMFVCLGGTPPPSREDVEKTLKEWGWHLSRHEDMGHPEGSEWAEALGNEETIFLVSLMKADDGIWKLVRFQEARAEHEENKKAAGESKWLLRIETQWDPHYPIDSFRQQIQFCAPFVIEKKNSLFDLNSTHLFSSEEVYDLAFGKVPPRATHLFIVHDLYPPDGPDNDGHWLHTHGLNRAGLPEFELLNVPARYINPGGELLIAAADLLLGGGHPPLRKTIQVGNGLKVALVEWEKIVVQLPLDGVGTMQGRTMETGAEDFFHTGYRVAVVSQKPRGFFRKKWSLPVTVLSAIAKGEDGMIWKSTAEIERLKILANERWGIFCKLYEKKKGEWRFWIKLGCPMDAAGTRHEYLWFEVLEMQKDRVRTLLKSQPFGVKKFKAGEEAWQPLERIADWKILHPDRDYTPEDAPQLVKTLEGKSLPAEEKSAKPAQGELFEKPAAVSAEKSAEPKHAVESKSPAKSPTPPPGAEPPKDQIRP